MDNSAFIMLAGEKVRVLNDSDEFLFLLAHGLSHSFHRLQWLYDLIVFSDKNNESETLNIEVKGKDKYLYNIFLACRNILFLRKGVLKLPEDNKKFIIHFLKTITKPTPKYHILRNWQDAYGRILLSRNFKGKIHVLTAQLTSPKDWQLISLKDRFFWMYFLMRPFLSFERIFQKK
jgi:hypothetical protein